MTDCPHIHIQDTGLQAFRDIIKEETDGGRDIVRFLKGAVNREYSNYEPHHELEAAKTLAKYGFEEAVVHVRRHRAPSSRRPSNNGRAPSTPQPDRDPIIEPVLNDMARAIREETDNGRTIVRNLIQIMETREKPYKPHHNLEAAKQLTDHGFPLTDALVCSPDCSHHAIQQSDIPSESPDDTDSTQEETVPDPKWLEAIAEVQRMKDESILTPDPNAPKIDYSVYMTGTEEEIRPYADEVSAKFRAELDLQIERQKQWPEIEERRRKKLAQIYPSYSDDKSSKADPPDT